MAIMPMMTRSTVYYQWNTKNQSFLDMHNYLKATGRRNDKFFMILYDSDLMYVNPRDPNLNSITKAKILRECMVNFWYFIREVVRIPTEGGAVGDGIYYKLHRGNLAFHFLFLNNYNTFLELPRQNGKTTAALVQYLWVFNFRTSNSKIMFIHQKHQRAKENLAELKDLRDALPSYLRFDSVQMSDGSIKKVRGAAETLTHPTNYNQIRTMAGARSASQARNSARGMTVPMVYWDEFGFILYNREMYMAATPAFSRASENAKMNGAPYSIVITTTPGVLTTDEGVFAQKIKDEATQWNEQYYDYTREQLEELRKANTNSSFFHVIYSYKQLGRGEDYFKQMCVDLLNDWPAIRREVLLEWAKIATDCPFKEEDLETIESLCMKEPRSTILFGKAGQYQVKVWGPLNNMQYPPIIGVDVAGGYQSDSTAITIIDSQTTKVVATFNCNYISMPDTAELIKQLVLKYLPNAVVNVERDGGWGGSVLQILMNTKVRKNLYHERKERPLQEAVSTGGRMQRKMHTILQYGVNTKENRDRYFEILFQRVQYHKDKFIAPILASELRTLEYKKNGRIEHASTAHDDQLFSYMLALYVWYDGENLANYGVYKTTLKTDQELDEATIDIEGEGGVDIDLNVDTRIDDLINEQMKQLGNIQYMDERSFRAKEHKKDQEALRALLENDINARKAYIKKYHLDPENLGPLSTRVTRDLPEDVFTSDPYDEKEYDIYQGSLGSQFKNIRSPR